MVVRCWVAPINCGLRDSVKARAVCTQVIFAVVVSWSGQVLCCLSLIVPVDTLLGGFKPSSFKPSSFKTSSHECEVYFKCNSEDQAWGRCAIGCKTLVGNALCTAHVMVVGCRGNSRWGIGA